MNENKDEKDCEKKISVEEQKFADFSKVQKRTKLLRVNK